MAKTNNPKNGQKEMAKNIKRLDKGELLPPPLTEGKVKPPKRFDSIGDVISEQQRLYKMVFTGELLITDMTKLMYGLQQIIQGIKTRSEMDVLENAYSKQWTGVRIIAPESATRADPHDLAIEGEIIDG